MKKIKILFIVLFVIGLILGLYFGLNKKKEEKTDAIKFKTEYESLNGTIREKDKQTIRSLDIDKDNPFIYATEEDIIKKMDNKETFAVYFGFTDCPWCRSVLPSLIEVAKELKISKIYYVNVKEIRDTLVYEDGEVKTEKEGSEGYYKLLEKLDSVLSDYTLKDSEGNTVETKEKRIFAPNIVAIISGKAEKLETGISSEQTDAYMTITDDMKKEMKEKLKCALSCVKENEAVCENAC